MSNGTNWQEHYKKILHDEVIQSEDVKEAVEARDKAKAAWKQVRNKAQEIDEEIISLEKRKKELIKEGSEGDDFKKASDEAATITDKVLSLKELKETVLEAEGEKKEILRRKQAQVSSKVGFIFKRISMEEQPAFDSAMDAIISRYESFRSEATRVDNELTARTSFFYGWIISLDKISKFLR